MRATPRQIALYSYNYAPELTGIGRYNALLCRWLAHRTAFTVCARTGIPHYPWWEVPPAYRHRRFRHGAGDEVIDGVTVERVRHYVPNAPVTARKRLLLDLTWAWTAAWRSLSTTRRPDVIIVVYPPLFGMLLGCWLRWRWGCPVLCHVQDLQVDAALELAVLPPFGAELLRWFERRLLARVDLITTCGDGMRRRLLAKHASIDRVAIFRNWADPPKPTVDPADNRYRQEWNVDGTPVVMYSGNLGEKQGIEDLIEAVIDHVSDAVQLVIAGRGASLQRIAEALSGFDRGRLLDLQPDQRLWEFLSAGDIHCIPQRQAAGELVMPSKLVNIMAVGRPVVVCARRGTDLDRLVRIAGCGVVVPPESPAALGRAIDRLARDPDLRERLGQAGRRFVDEHLAEGPVLERFHGLLKRLPARHGRWPVRTGPRR